jgi:hypothetical protein
VVAQLFAEPQSLAQMLLGRFELAPVALDAPQVVEGVGQPRGIVKLGEHIDRAAYGVERIVQVAGEPVGIGQGRQRVALSLHGADPASEQPGLFEDRHQRRAHRDQGQ